MPLTKANAIARRAHRKERLTRLAFQRICSEIDYALEEEDNHVLYKVGASFDVELFDMLYEVYPFEELSNDDFFNELNSLYNNFGILLEREFIPSSGETYRGIEVDSNKYCIHIKDLK